jgi:hypothetical protein
MAYSTQEKDLGTVTVATAATQYSTVWNALDVTMGVIQVAWKDLTHADGTVTLQYSLDGTNYHDYAAATTMAATPGAKAWPIDILAKFYRVKIVKTSNTAGTCVTLALGKHA